MTPLKKAFMSMVDTGKTEIKHGHDGSVIEVRQTIGGDGWPDPKSVASILQPGDSVTIKNEGKWIVVTLQKGNR